MCKISLETKRNFSVKLYKLKVFLYDNLSTNYKLNGKLINNLLLNNV